MSPEVTTKSFISYLKNGRLQQITGSSDTAYFGNMAILAVGDLVINFEQYIVCKGNSNDSPMMKEAF